MPLRSEDKALRVMLLMLKTRKPQNCSPRACLPSRMAISMHTVPYDHTSDASALAVRGYSPPSCSHSVRGSFFEITGSSLAAKLAIKDIRATCPNIIAHGCAPLLEFPSFLGRGAYNYWLATQLKLPFSFWAHWLSSPRQDPAPSVQPAIAEPSARPYRPFGLGA